MTDEQIVKALRCWIFYLSSVCSHSVIHTIGGGKLYGEDAERRWCFSVE